MLKSVREREGVTAHMVAGVGAAAGEWRPVPHRVVPDVMPAEAYRRLVAHLPHAAHFEPVAGSRRAGRRRRFLLAAPDIHTLPADEARFWSDVARLFDGPRLREALGADPAAPLRVTLERGAPGAPLALSGAGEGAAVLFALVLPTDDAPVRLALARRGLAWILSGGRPHRRAVAENTGLLLPGGSGGAAPVARLEPADGGAVTVLLARFGGAAAERGR